MAAIVKWLTFVFWFQHAYSYPQPNIEEVRNWNLEQLKGYLLGHSNALYEKIKSTARHTAHQSGSTVVNVTVNLLGLADVSEWQMNYRVSLELIQAWNQSDWAYGYIFQGVRPEKYIEFDPEREFPRIWSPSTYFVNEITEEKSSFKWQKIVRYDLSKHIFTTPNVICRLYENGTLLLIERTTVRLACLMDLINYPMDEQQCPMKISSFAFSSHEVQYRWDHVRRGPIHLPDHGVQLSEYSISRIEHNVCTVHRKSDIFPCIESTLFLKRNPSSYIVQFYLPSSMFVCLSWLSFYVDIDSVVGRVYFAVFLVVTMVGQMMYILARVPPVAYVKAIDVWMDACLVFVSLVLVEYAIVKVKMKKATRKGLQLGSYFEKKDGDDLSADDIIPEVMKPWSKLGKMKPETIQKDSPKKVSSTLISRQRRMTLKEVKEIRLSRAQHGRPPSFASRVKTRATQELKVMKANEAYFIDVISRVLFPFLFAIFNVIYWSYYLTRY